VLDVVIIVVEPLRGAADIVQRAQSRSEAGCLVRSGEDRPLAFFAGLWTARWTGVRKIKRGFEKTDLYAFLTTDPNAEVGAVYTKAMR
jgi:putative SOS response-associated peptidase YedK